MSAFKIYLMFSLLPNLGTVLSMLAGFITIGSVIALIFLGFMRIDAYGAKEQRYASSVGKKWVRQWVRVILPLFLFALFASSAIPSKKEMAEIFGISYLTQIHGAEKLPQNLVNKLNEILTEESGVKND